MLVVQERQYRSARHGYNVARVAVTEGVGVSRYVERALADVARWVDRGWIDAEAASAIRADLASRRGGFALPHVFVMLGAVMLVLSALTFVAANWDDIPRLARLVMLAAALAASHAVALFLHVRGHAAFAQAALLVANGVFGAAIMLVGQMYHLDANPADAVLVWALGATVCCAVYAASSVWVFAFALFCLWSAGLTADGGQVQWIFPAVALAMAALAWMIAFRGARHLVALSLTVWVVTVPVIRDASFFPYQTTIIGALVCAAGAAVMVLRRRGDTVFDDNAPLALMYGYAVAFCGLFMRQFLERDPGMQTFSLLALLTIALSLAVLAVGRACGRGMALWVAYLGFSIEIVAVYFHTVGTLIHTSVFFFTVGAVIIVLAWLGIRLRRVQTGDHGT